LQVEAYSYTIKRYGVKGKGGRRFVSGAIWRRWGSVVHFFLFVFFFFYCHLLALATAAALSADVHPGGPGGQNSAAPLLASSSAGVSRRHLGGGVRDDPRGAAGLTIPRQTSFAHDIYAA